MITRSMRSWSKSSPSGSDVDDPAASRHRDWLAVLNPQRANFFDRGRHILNVAVDRLFETKLKRQWTCRDCNAVNQMREANFGLQIPIGNRRYDSLKRLSECIREYFAPENLTVRCNSAKCGGKDAQRARGAFITSAPEILVIQIIRMGYNPRTGNTFKVRDRVQIDEVLELSDYTTRLAGTDVNKALRYQLYGVVSHVGETLQLGHYIATVRCQNGVDFATVNDSHVEYLKMSKERALKSLDTQDLQSYIVMYQKVGGDMAKCI